MAKRARNSSGQLAQGADCHLMPRSVAACTRAVQHQQREHDYQTAACENSQYNGDRDRRERYRTHAPGRNAARALQPRCVRGRKRLRVDACSDSPGLPKSLRAHFGVRTANFDGTWRPHPVDMVRRWIVPARATAYCRPSTKACCRNCFRPGRVSVHLLGFLCA
jgi:hypothetical protein